MTTTTGATRRIYLDYAAATPLHERVKAAMLPYLTEFFGNPSAIHTEGKLARQAVEAARLEVARTLAIKPEGVIFTGSGTESNNLSILGYLDALKANGRSYESMEVITTAIEHPSILALLPVLKAKGVVVHTVAVDTEGVITSEALKTCLSPKTVLVAFAYANSEVGTVQPVSRLARVVRQYEQVEGIHIMIHLDAAQAPLWLPCQLETLGVDMLALDAGKCGGPKGVGVLALRKNVIISAETYGGGQERGLRPGTENVAGIVGMATALALAQADASVRAEKVRSVRDQAISLLCEQIPGLVINGQNVIDRLPNNINLSLPGFDTEYAVVYLDAAGIAASTKSACAGAGSGMSHVVLALTGDASLAKSTIRFTLGEETTIADLKEVVRILQQFCQKMQTLT